MGALQESPPEALKEYWDTVAEHAISKKRGPEGYMAPRISKKWRGQ